MAMTVDLPAQLDARLSYLTEQTGKAKSEYLIQALENYLEDMEDILLSNTVLERVRRGEEKTYSAQEVRDAIKMARGIR